MIRRTLPHDPERNATAYVSGDLPRRVAHWFEAHLLDCEDCWREVWLARLGRRIAEHGRELAPASLRDNVRAAVSMAGQSKPRRRWRRTKE